MHRSCLIPIATLNIFALMELSAAAQRYSESPYAKRVMAVQTLDRDVRQKRFEAKGMLRAADELQRKKPRSQADAQMIVTRYDEHTRTLIRASRHDTQVLVKIATIGSETDVAQLRQELEIEKRSMELQFQKQQAARAQLRKSQRQRGTKARNNRPLQAVIEQQKQAKQAFDEALKVTTEQLNTLRTIESAGGPGGKYDTAGNQLHSKLTRFEFDVQLQRQVERPWVEKQAEYALLENVEERVRLRDALRTQAAKLRQQADRLNEEAATLLSGPTAADDLRQLANLVRERVVRPTAKVSIELTAPSNASVSYAPTGIAVVRQKLAFNGRIENNEFELTLSPSLTLEETHAPKWASKFKGKYPFVHSAGELSLWVGGFHMTIRPANGLTRRVDPDTQTLMLQWVDDTVRLDQLATL